MVFSNLSQISLAFVTYRETSANITENKKDSKIYVSTYDRK
jgi:hypothetical protein